jgi:DNA-binding LacI/PurR family transcriptional regulator
MKTIARNQSRLPAYLRIARLLRERIAQQAYRHEEFLPAERELAQELSVSRQTVRLAIETLRAEGLILPEQGRGNRIVRKETSDDAGNANDAFRLVAIIIYGISREGSAAIVASCQAAVNLEGFHLIVCETARDTTLRAENEAAHLRTLMDKGIEGILLYTEPTDRNHALLQEALDRGVHLVQVDRYLPDLPCDYVGVDNGVAAQRMTEHLLSVGRRRIAFLSNRPEPSSCRERLAGYRAALESHGGLPPIVGYGKGSEESLLAIVEGWLDLPEPPDAIFAVNDSTALLVMQALRKRGVSIPQEMAVVGFDDQYVATYVSPPLTTVRQPFGALGETAAHLLLDRMTGRYKGAPRRVLLPTDLVIRRSCGGSSDLVEGSQSLVDPEPTGRKEEQGQVVVR